MAWATGTASNHADLLTRLRDFLTGNAALVSAGQAWQVVGGTVSGAVAANGYVSLKGQGLAGNDAIYLSLQAYTVPASSYYNLALRGHTGYDAANPGLDPIGANSKYVSLLLVNAPIAYWFIANGRCFKVVTKVNGRYDAMYGGFMLPEHLPSDWSYPLFIGGSYLGLDAAANLDSDSHSNFWNPMASGSSNTASTQSYLFSPIQSWVPLRNRWGSSIYSTGRLVLPWSKVCNNNLRRLLDGQVWLQRAQLAAFRYPRESPDRGSPDSDVPEGGQFYGSLDGVFYVPSFDSAAEQIVTVGGVDHLLVPNVYRTGDGEFAALALE